MGGSVRERVRKRELEGQSFSRAEAGHRKELRQRERLGWGERRPREQKEREWEARKHGTRQGETERVAIHEHTGHQFLEEGMDMKK